MIVRGIVLCLAAVALAACSSSSSNDGSSTAEDSSTSGAVTSAVGGSLGSSSQNGTVSFNTIRKPLWLQPFFSATAEAGNSCPTLLSTSGCAVSGGVATLTYSNCNFGTSSALWNGYMTVRLSSGSMPACGSFPSPTSVSLERQTSTSGGAAGTVTRVSAGGTTVTVDDTVTTVHANYESDPFDSTGVSGQNIAQFNSGYGSAVAFNASGKRTSVTLAENISATNSGGTQILDHTVAGVVNLTESTSSGITSWTASSGTVTGGACTIGGGGINVYHNLIKMLATTCLQNVTYNTTCCTPVSGTVTTTFAKTAHSYSSGVLGTLDTAMNGKSETLTITGCGTATYTDYAGNSASVKLANCF